MKRFAYLTADTFDAASKSLAGSKDARPKAGGLDLLDLMKERLEEPTELVNLLRAERDVADGQLSALATLDEIATDERIAKDYPVLHKAAAEAGTPQVRNVATLGGNLAQHTRCWYFRDKTFSCFRRGGMCSAMLPDAQNRYHAIFKGGACVCTHPSNLAPALVALGAKVVTVHPDGGRELPVEALYHEPRARKANDVDLKPGELIKAVALPPASPLTRNSVYLEVRERLSFDFAVASVAAAVHVEGGEVKEARIVCGMVAPSPYRAKAAEQALVGKKLDATSVAAAAKAAVKDARPLAQNGFKVQILETLIRRALGELNK